LPADIKGRNVLTYLLKGPLEKSGVNREELIQFFLLLAKGRLSRNELVGAVTGQADNPVSQRTIAGRTSYQHATDTNTTYATPRKR